MKKPFKNNENSMRYMELIALNTNEQKFSFGLQVMEFVHNLHKQGLHKDLSIKLIYDPSDDFENKLKK